jgi:diguanylate cyclase (GGDEF)-like protein
MFQRREYFDVEAARYAALAGSGHVVVVAFRGPVDEMPDGVTAIALSEEDPRARDWALLCVRGAYATSLHAHDTLDLSLGEMTLQASRVFDARWSFDRAEVLRDARSQLDACSGEMDAVAVERARQCIDQSASEIVSRGEARLATAAATLLTSIEIGQRRLTRMRTELEEIALVAERDQLTGLNNRHFLERFLGSEDRPTDLLALLIDVDDLKVVNDSFGHDAGDAVLVAVASTLRAHTRIGDIVIRWGGDEFLLLLPRVSGDGGLAVGEALAAAIQRTRCAPPWEHIAPSVSIGVCWARRTSLPIHHLDEALYAVKRGGKGHAGIWPDPTLPDATGVSTQG